MSTSRGASRSRPCSHVADGQPCRAWAVRGSEPPRCAAHRVDGGPAVGAPPGNANRVTHGAYARPASPPATIDDVIADLADKQARLTAYLEAQLAGGGDVSEVVKVFQLHGQNASRLGRLLRDQAALSAAGAGSLEDLERALDELSDELGVQL